jgi:hypothetical protein
MRDTSAATAAAKRQRRPRSRERGAAALSERTLNEVRRILVDQALAGNVAAGEALLRADIERHFWLGTDANG